MSRDTSLWHLPFGDRVYLSGVVPVCVFQTGVMFSTLAGGGVAQREVQLGPNPEDHSTGCSGLLGWVGDWEGTM
jgi:hypothetical protein